MIACEIKRKHALVYIFFEMTVSINKINFPSMCCLLFWWISFIVPKSLWIWCSRPKVFFYLFCTVLVEPWVLQCNAARNWRFHWNDSMSDTISTHLLTTLINSNSSTDLPSIDWLLYYAWSISRKWVISKLTLLAPMSHFYIPWKRQKTFGFMTFSGRRYRNEKLTWKGLKWSSTVPIILRDLGSSLANTFEDVVEKISWNKRTRFRK